MYLYAASFSPAGIGGYSVYQVDTKACTASLIQEAFPGISAGTAVYNPENSVLYCTDERRNHPDFPLGGGGSVYAVKLDPETGMMSEINHTYSYGPAPSFAALDQSGRYLVLTNFGTDKIVSPATVTKKGSDGEYHVDVYMSEVSAVLYALGADGSIGKVLDIHKFEPELRDHVMLSAHAHSVRLSPDGKYFFVCDMGTDKLYMFGIDRENDKLFLAAGSPYRCPAGFGPRYSAFHPRKPFVFVNMEEDPSVCSFAYDDEGRLSALDRVVIVPEDTKLHEDDLQSGFTMSADGNYLYTLMRGQNIIAVIRADEENGKLSLVQTCKLRGDRPKDCMISPDGRLLAVANRGSGDIEFWKVGSDGLLSPDDLRIEKEKAGFVFWKP